MTASSESLHFRPERAPRTARVLVIDDELFVVQALRLVLSREFDVRGTTSVAQALTWLHDTEPFDVILCDLSMRGAGGGVALRDRIAAVNPEQAARIVFVTGGALLPAVQSELAGMSNPVLEKPIDMGALRDLIRGRARGTWHGAARTV
jgi:DNA-binding NtrC family response regulator